MDNEIVLDRIQTGTPPSITVCVCTRDRAPCIAQALLSIQGSTFSDFEVIVVDQSATDSTEVAVRHSVGNDARFRYVRSSSRGASAARNEAIALARAPIVACTDDDCEVTRNWLERLASHFSSNPSVGLICGAVRAEPHDRSRGFIPTCEVPRKVYITKAWLKWRWIGISANMAFRRLVLQTIGLFDELLCPGAALYSAEDRDMTYRVLRAGYTVLMAPDVQVVHHGFREWKQGGILMRQTGVGIAAVNMKHLRLGDTAIVPSLLIEGVLCIKWSRLVHRQRYIGVRCFIGYLRGCLLSFDFAVDTRQRTYLVPHRSRVRAGSFGTRPQ